MNYIVYSFTVPGETLPFYVGKGRPHRPQQHFASSSLKRKSHFYSQLNSLLLKGIYPEIKIIASDLTASQALEQSLIEVYGRRDNGTGCLCNHTDGGIETLGYEKSIDARINHSHPVSKEGRENIRLAVRTRTAVPVESYDLETGKVIQYYAAQSDVKLDGFNQGNVGKVLAGTRRQHGGYGWNYA